MNPREEVLDMARRFVSGEDRSMAFVASMEDFATEHLLNTEAFEFLAEGISLYRPWAGTPYWSEREMVQLMKEFIEEFGPPEGE
ncbi:MULTISPECIES: hypothetical protein [unclassified Streptomyces]|uniref:hypothetical protein n=1 Tax=unclassified Streptomyces TaxID=2593676 RepID=UPI001331187C|nr:hypothetical protein [Streptomyces sp. SAT1]